MVRLPPQANPKKYGNGEAQRPPEACEHLDTVEWVALDTKVPVVIKVARGTMSFGAVSACAFCGEKFSKPPYEGPAGTMGWDPAVAATVKVQIGDAGTPKPRGLVWLDEMATVELAKPHCFQLAGPRLPVNDDVYLHFDCSAAGKPGALSIIVAT